MKKASSSSQDPARGGGGCGGGGVAENSGSDAQYVYEARGDASSALDILKTTQSPGGVDSSSSFDMNHNIALLAYLSFPNQAESDDDLSSKNVFQNQLEEMYISKQKEGDSVSFISMQKLVLGHNLALNYLITNKPEEGVSILLPLFRSFSAEDGAHENKVENNNFEFGDIKCKIAFLLLDCILASCKIHILNEILLWIEAFISWAISNRDESTSSSLKFRLHCYKSKGLFLQNKYEDSSAREANNRVAKKELKSAMEIYHHKLAKKQGIYHRVCSGGGESIGTGIDEGASVQGSLAPSIGSMSHDPQDAAAAIKAVQIGDAGNGNTNIPENRTLSQTKRLYRQNQCALYLKANLEHLKGNTKKSLKLCSEAQHCGVRQRDSSDQQAKEQHQKWVEELELSSDVQSAYHFNNLAIIHQTAGKFHLAMHYYSRSLGYVERVENQARMMGVEKDGVASPVPLSQIFFNASLCAQQLSNFSTAHECMKRCVESHPSSFEKDPVCWLHMGESCVNSHVALKRKSRRINGASTSNFTSDADLTFNSSSLPRAVDCFNQCIILCNKGNHNRNCIYKTRHLESARVLLAYVWIELNNPSQVVQLAEVMLKEKPLCSSKNSKNHSGISLRRRATMRMYACEALCMLGIPSEGLNYLNSDSEPKNVDTDSGNNVNELAAQLARVDIMRKKRLNQGERKRLKHAKASIQISTAMTKLSLNDVSKAQDDAQSACSMLHNEVGMKELKANAYSSLIQSLICGGKIAEAAQLARNLK